MKEVKQSKKKTRPHRVYRRNYGNRRKYTKNYIGMEHHVNQEIQFEKRVMHPPRQYDKFADFFCKLLDICQNIERDLPHAARPNNKLSS